MDRPHVTLHYERDVPYPPDVAYAWLTDYQDDDHTKAGAIVKRRDVVSRTDREVVLDGELETFGSRARGRAVVSLVPEEHRWTATIGNGGWVYEYRLVPRGTGSRLIIDYRFGSRRWTRRATIAVLKPLLRREIDKMWDGFLAAMAREVPKAPEAPRPAA